MMIITRNIKKAILKQLETNELVRIPASEEEYFSVVYDLPFKLEYHDSEIITMGLASYWHETLVMALGNIMYNLLAQGDAFNVLGSNSGIHISKFEGGYYMPDVVVVKGEPVFKTNSTAIITNPYIIVEVLSPSTMQYDISEKLEEYKTIESLQQIIFVHQKKVSVSSYLRTDKPNTWLHQDCRKLEDSIIIENSEVSLATIYRKIKFE